MCLNSYIFVMSIYAVKGGLNQFLKLFTMIPSMPKDFNVNNMSIWKHSGLHLWGFFVGR